MAISDRQALWALAGIDKQRSEQIINIQCPLCPIMYIMSFYIWMVLPLKLCAMTLIHPARHICHIHQSRIVNPPHALPDHPAYCDRNVWSLGLGCLISVVDYRLPYGSPSRFTLWNFGWRIIPHCRLVKLSHRLPLVRCIYMMIWRHMAVIVRNRSDGSVYSVDL